MPDRNYIEKGEKMFVHSRLLRKQKLIFSGAVLALLVVLFLAACTSVQNRGSATATPQPTFTATIAPTLTATPTPSATLSPEEALPAEIRAQVDHIETLPDGRIVAIAKVTEGPVVFDATKFYPTPMINNDWQGCRKVDITANAYSGADPARPLLRKWQWDGKEWVDYVPQVGKISINAADWDRVDIDDLPVSELQKRMQQKPWTGINYQEIKQGLVVNYYDAFLLSGVIVDYDFQKVNETDINTNLVVAVPLPTGDIELFFVEGMAPTLQTNSVMSVFNATLIDPQYLSLISKKTAKLGIICIQKEFPRYVKMTSFWQYFAEVAQKGEPVNIIFTIDKFDYPVGGKVINETAHELEDHFLNGGEVLNSDQLEVYFDWSIALPQSEFNKIK